MVTVNKKGEVSELPYEIMDINLRKANHCGGIVVMSSFQTAHVEKLIRFVFGLTPLCLL
ncbi:hypothetical protein MSP8887_00325 [Marinomonas spartinae]|uniref:hypothetical protein n=1 Tax=Marinomonas spartinae TaxID=1792290 RepID=UPI000808DEDC|nr:hypothetical protein [Marinomonas spartinae]SBS26061.1 hypothetical protein MSP8887_00325 [Marinomonas spartinae]